MSSPSPHIFLFGCVLLPVIATAQSAAIETNVVDTTNRQLEASLVGRKREKKKTPDIPMLYDGELEDSGPQLLLLEPPPHEWLQLLCDTQFYFTSNATMAERDTTGTDVFALTAQGAITPKSFALFGGKVYSSAGFRYQHFRYGLLSGSNKQIHNSYLPVDSMNFEAYTPYAQFDWRSGPWTVGLGARFSAYRSLDSEHTTYQEWAPSLQAARTFSLGENQQFSLGGDFTYRFSHSFLPPGISLPPGWFYSDQNDRYDLGLTLAYTVLLREKWLIQPSYRFQFSHYTQTSVSRQDYYHILSLTVGYQINDYLSLRGFCSAEFRDSTDDVVADYKNFNGGLGLMGMLRF